MILIGFLEIKKIDRIGKLTIAIPFWNKSEFYISENKNKTKDTQPDFLIWHAKISIGGLWKGKYTKEGIEKNYMSGSIKVINKDLNNLLKIACFESTDTKESWSANVFWSDEEKKTIDGQAEMETINQDEGGDIF